MCCIPVRLYYYLTLNSYPDQEQFLSINTYAKKVGIFATKISSKQPKQWMIPRVLNILGFASDL